MSVFNPIEPRGRRFLGFWFDADGVELSRRVYETVRILRHEQRYITDRYRMAMQLYQNLVMPGITEGMEAGWQFGGSRNTVGPYALNIVESTVDTIHAEITGNRVRVQYLTDGGSWEGQQKAKELTKFTDGVFDEAGMRAKIASRMALDAYVFGDGWFKVYEDEEERIKFFNVMPMNIVFDDVEAANGTMSCLFEERFISRHVLAADFKGDKTAYASIMNAPEVTFYGIPERSSGDLIRVIESWQPARGKTDGRHILAVSETSEPIVDEAWKNKAAPFVHMTYKDRLNSILGKGIPEIICGHQEFITDLREKIHAQLMGASPFLWMKTGSRLTEAEISNHIWRCIESDEPPQHIAFASVPPDLFNQLQEEQNESATSVGVNQTMMRGEVPAGLSGSGRSLRVYNDTKSKRFTRAAQAYEQMHVDAAEMLVDVFDDLADGGRGYETGYRGEDGLEKIDYRDIRLPKNSFYIRKYPTNFLSDTPAGRLAEIESLANIAPELKPYLVGLLRNPDVEYATSQLSVQESSVRRIAEKLITTDTQTGDIPPIPEMDLGLAIHIMKNYIVDATSREVPDDRIDKCRQWVVIAEAMQQQGMPSPAPAPPMMDMQPPEQMQGSPMGQPEPGIPGIV